MPAFETPQPITVVCELSVGTVHLIASDRADTTVAVNPTDSSSKQDVEAARQTEVDHAGDRLTIRAPRPRGLGQLGFARRYSSIDLVIELPAGSQFEAKADIADFRVDGTLGAVRIKTGMGELRLGHTGTLHLHSSSGVTVEHAAGDANVTGGGDIRIGTIDGTAEVKNVNGRIWLGEVTDHVRAKSANGDITIDRAHADVVAKTASGAVTIGEVVRGAVELRTAAGALAVGIRQGTAAWIDAQSKFGRIRNDLEATAGTAPAADTADPTDTAEIRLRTGYGDIHIHRS